MSFKIGPSKFGQVSCKFRGFGTPSRHSFLGRLAESGQEEHRKKVILGIVRLILCPIPTRTSSLKNGRAVVTKRCILLCEDAQKNIWIRENTEGFELCELSEKVQCIHSACVLQHQATCVVGVGLYFSRSSRSRNSGTNTQVESETI